MIGKRLRFETSHAPQFGNTPARLRNEFHRSGLKIGRVHLQSLHTTVGLAINENEPLLIRDFESLLERLAPVGASYQHDAFARRIDVALDEPVNGHAHCRQILLTGFATLLVEDGELVLGRWQSVFAVELDGPRHRELALQLDGEFGTSSLSPSGEQSVVPSSMRLAHRARERGEERRTATGPELVELALSRQLLVDPEPVSAPMRRLVEAGGQRQG